MSMPRRALRPGVLISGKYEIISVIGSGGFGITYLAKDKATGEKAAIKEFFPEQCAVRGPDGIKINVFSEKTEIFGHMFRRFLEEGQAMYNLRAVPDMLRIYGVFSENNTGYLVMEYLEGMNLGDYVKQKGGSDWNELSVYVKMVLNTLRRIHEKGLIHRDISPDNIFITGDGRAKLIDFGSLRTYNTGSNLTTVLKHSFAPYEQYSAEGSQGPWTDIYALSVTIYYCLTGVLPARGTERITEDNTPGVSMYRKDIPSYVDRAIARGMAPAIKDRFQSAGEMIKALFTDNYRYYVTGKKGIYGNKRLRILPGQTVDFGRDRACPFVFPQNAPGISRRQCSVFLDESGEFYLRDDGSSYGTFYKGRQLTPEKWIPVEQRSEFRFASEVFYCCSEID